MTPKTISEEVLRLDDARVAAMLAKDLVALDRLMAEDALYIHSLGNADGKRAYIDMLGNPLFRYVAFDRTDLAVSVFEDSTAIVTGRAHIIGEMEGRQLELFNLVVTTWVRFPEGWRFVLSQSTPLPV